MNTPNENELKTLLELEQQPDSFWAESFTQPTPFNDPMFQDILNPIEEKCRHLAHGFMVLGKLSKAYHYCEIGLTANPKSAFLYYVRGRVMGDTSLYANQSEPEKLLINAIHDLFTAITLKPDFVDAYVWLGYFNAKNGDSKESEKCYDLAKRLDPNIKFPID